jgi:hypothetical protein
MDDRDVLRTAAERLERLVARTTPGDWRTGGLLASRPEVIAHRDGGTEHVAEARAGTAEWIIALSPAVGPPLVGWLRAAAEVPSVDPSAAAFGRVLLGRLP